ncbi:MAG TPA: glycosyltransferase, partial [Bryobacteraceae bacterium]|nr:glycosyltransferase [Bryobacteraceae bacterium]
MTAGFHSPLPPAPTGVADYTAALLPELRKHLEVRSNPDEDCDVELYHVGNNPLHAKMYARALRKPGVVVLHDAVLNHFYLGALDEKSYVEEFVYNYGEWHRELARELWRGRARSGSDTAYFDWPMIGRICRSARTVIVHNPGAGAAVARHVPETPVVEIPHLWAPFAEPDKADVRRLRAQLGVPEGALLASVFGHLRETKRLGAILRTVARLRASGEAVFLLVAGDFVSGETERSFAYELTQPGIIRRGYLEEGDFWLHATAVDVCVNLRYPSAGESSGIAVRLMSAGCATMLTANAETSRFPEGTCMRCDSGTAEEEQIAAYLLWALRNPDPLRLMGQSAAAYIRREHSLARA